MQLSQLVNFHKVLGDPVRLKILYLLGSGPMSGLELSDRLGLSAPTISHHMTRLREVGAVNETREKNTIFFTVNDENIVKESQNITKFLLESRNMEENGMCTDEREMETVVRSFFDSSGCLKAIPGRYKRRLMILEHLAKGLEPGRKYSEDDINNYISRFHEDYFTIRREFVENHFMYRENGIYELNPKEMWTNWRTLK